MFNKNKTKTILKWAQSIDGQLADDDDQSQWISGEEERIFTHKIRATCDAVLVGATTFLRDLAQLTVRLVPFDGDQPVRIILDPRARVINQMIANGQIYKAITSGPRRTYLVTDVLEQGDFELIRQDENITHIQYRFENFKQWLPKILTQVSIINYQINRKKIETILIEGGAQTISEFIKSDLVDEIYVTVSPLLLGGKKNRINMTNNLKEARRLELKKIYHLGSDTVIQYKTKKLAEKEH